VLAAGTNLEAAQCPQSGSGGTANCAAAYLALHLTPSSTAYLEVGVVHSHQLLIRAKLHLQGTWVWLADHDLDGDGVSKVTIYSGRGILSESAGPVWMIGTGCEFVFCRLASRLVLIERRTAEHHVLYQYNLVNAKNHFMGLIQTESVCSYFSIT